MRISDWSSDVCSSDLAANRQHTPKVAFVAPPADYVSSSGKPIKANDIDLNVRALSMGKLHHAMMGTAAVAIGTAAAIPGTLRSEERRVGEDCVSTCRSRVCP